MTKRTLLIIIVLLVVIDIVAAFWYLALRIENSGQSTDFFSSTDSASVLEADTLTESTIADVFTLASHKAVFVSQNTSGSLNQPLLSVKQVGLRWPSSVNGNDSLVNLERELVRKAFGRNYGTLDDAVNSYLNEPQFNYGNGVDYVRVPQEPEGISARQRNTRQLMIYPYSTSFALLVMEIDHIQSNGETRSKRTAYVLYDRVRQRVIERHEVLQAERESSLLAVINQKIARLNQEKHLDLLSASQVPAELCPKRAGILFEFQEGDIAPSGKGVIDVMVEYSQLRPFLTETFNRLVATNGGYWEYKSLKP